MESAYNNIKQLTVVSPCNTVDIDSFTEMLLEWGCSSVSAEVTAENRSEIAHTLMPWEVALVKAQVPKEIDVERLIELIRVEYPHLTVKVEDLEESAIDWVRQVEQSRPIIRVGDLTIRFPWNSLDDRDSTDLLLEGGIAFGTGEHPTTRLCLSWLQKELATRKGQRPSVLDYGCGSGVLALSALKIGADYGAGVDIDVDSLLAARRNAASNNISSLSLFLASDSDVDTVPSSSNPHEFPPVSLLGGSFDVVVANIFAPVLLELASSLANRTAARGSIALSGILSSQTQQVRDGFAKHFESVHVEEECDGWALVVGHNPKRT